MIFTDDLEILKKECLENGEDLKTEPGVIMSKTPFVILHGSAWRDGEEINHMRDIRIAYPCYQPANPKYGEEEWYSFSFDTNVILLKQLGFPEGAYKWARYDDHRELFENEFGLTL